MFENWKFHIWKKEQIDRNDIDAYIGYKIYPEDIEIFSNILYPDLMEYKNCIIKLPSGCTPDEKEDIQLLFDSWLNKNLPIDQIEKIMNHTMVSEIFFETANNSSISTLENVANLISINWDICLKRKFPQKNFEVIVSNEDGEIFLTFSQADHHSKP